MNNSIQIVLDDLSGSPIIQLLEEHLADMYSSTPAENELMGCGALKELSGGKRGEIKSMRTAAKHLRKGVASALLDNIIDEAKKRSYKQLLLETGSTKEFESARALYVRAGFVACPPFEKYKEDPNSVFMLLAI